MSTVQPGFINTFVPSHEATGKLIVDFARNPARFKLARYAQVIPVQQSAGYFLYLPPEDVGRILNADLRDFVWQDGAEVPKHHANREFEFRPYRTQRYVYEFAIGNEAVQQASWDVVAKHAEARVSLALTARTQAAANVLFDSAQYPSSHVIDVTTTYGGTWATSDLTSKRILKSLNDGADKILDGTLGAVTKDDLVLVMGTAVAKAIAQSTEVLELLKFQAGWDWVQGATTRTNVSYGVPENLYGYAVVVDETRKTTSKKGGTLAVSSVFPADKAVLLARPGGMEGVAGAVNFSACCLFMKEELTVETLDDLPNRRILGRVVENFDVQLVAPVSAVLFTNVA